MSRTGPAYVASEAELFADLARKQDNDEIDSETAQAFVDLYEFAKERCDRVAIGEAKNANFQAKVTAHQGNYRGDPSVFTANVSRELKVWTAGMPLHNDGDLSSVAWTEEDYRDFERKFQSLRGVPPESTTVAFETAASSADLVAFQSYVEEFVSTCRQKADE